MSMGCEGEKVSAKTAYCAVTFGLSRRGIGDFLGRLELSA